MSSRPLTRDEVRDIDRRALEDFAIPTILLMENAGRGVADLLQRLGIDGPVTVCVGKGNNGGDGLAVARHLDGRGHDVRVLLAPDAHALQGDAAVQLRIVAKAGIALEALGDDLADRLPRLLRGASWVVDALLGTGLRGAVRPAYAQAIAAINASGRRVVAIDLPSGLDCDTGMPLGAAVRALHTATLVAAKQGFAYPGAAQYTGMVHVIDLGLPRRLLKPKP